MAGKSCNVVDSPLPWYAFHVCTDTCFLCQSVLVIASQGWEGMLTHNLDAEVLEMFDHLSFNAKHKLGKRDLDKRTDTTMIACLATIFQHSSNCKKLWGAQMAQYKYSHHLKFWIKAFKNVESTWKTNTSLHSCHIFIPAGRRCRALFEERPWLCISFPPCPGSPLGHSSSKDARRSFVSRLRACSWGTHQPKIHSDLLVEIAACALLCVCLGSGEHKAAHSR